MEAVDEGLVFISRADLIKFALSSPPKCGCDVNSAALVLQVAKFNKYFEPYSFISYTVVAFPFVSN